jgi:integrase
VTVYFNAFRDRWMHDFKYQGRRYAGYCVDPETGAPAKNRKQAVAIEEAIKVGLRKGALAKKEPPPGYTVADCFADWLDSLGSGANRHNAEDHIAEFLARPEFAPTKPVAEVSDLDVERYIQWAAVQPLRVYLGGPSAASAAKRQARGLPLWKDTDRIRSRSTINHYLATLKAAFGYAARLKVNGTPLLKFVPTIRKMKGPVREVRAFLDTELEALIENAGTKEVVTRKGATKQVKKRPPPQYVIDAVLLCRLMGFRRREVINLDLRNMDDQRGGYWLRAEDTKGNRDDFVKAHPEAWNILVRLRDQALASGNTRLILARGPRGRSKYAPLRPIKDFRSSFDRVMEDVGFKGKYTFHNTKAAFVTAIADVADSTTTQRLARHRDYKTTQKYIAVRDGRKGAAVDAMPVFIVAAFEKARALRAFALLVELNRKYPDEW